MVAVESVYLVRMVNFSPKEIVNDNDLEQVYKNFGEQTHNVAEEISQTVFDKFCDKETDAVDVEIMKVSPIDKEELDVAYPI